MLKAKISRSMLRLCSKCGNRLEKAAITPGLSYLTGRILVCTSCEYVGLEPANDDVEEQEPSRLTSE